MKKLFHGYLMTLRSTSYHKALKDDPLTYAMTSSYAQCFKSILLEIGLLIDNIKVGSLDGNHFYSVSIFGRPNKFFWSPVLLKQSFLPCPSKYPPPITDCYVICSLSSSVDLSPMKVSSTPRN